MNRRERLRESAAKLARVFSAMLLVTGGLLGRRQDRGQVIPLKRAAFFQEGPEKTEGFDVPNIFCKYCKGGKQE